MSKANFSIEGFASEPKQRVSQSGKHMLDISVAHSPRKFNKQSNQWEPVKDRDGNEVTLWARATFFDDMADFLISQVTKGTLVRLEGEPRLNAYVNNGGQPQANLEIQFASLSIVPLKPRQGDSQTPQNSWSTQTPTDGSFGSQNPDAQVMGGGFGGFGDKQPF